MQHAGQNLENRILLLGREAQNLHRWQKCFEILNVALAIDLAISTLKRQTVIRFLFLFRYEDLFFYLPDLNKNICRV